MKVIEEREIRGISVDPNERILIRIDSEGAIIKRVIGKESGGGLYLYWKEWERVKENIEDVRRKMNEKVKLYSGERGRGDELCNTK